MVPCSQWPHGECSQRNQTRRPFLLLPSVQEDHGCTSISDQLICTYRSLLLGYQLANADRDLPGVAHAGSPAPVAGAGQAAGSPAAVRGDRPAPLQGDLSALAAAAVAEGVGAEDKAPPGGTPIRPAPAARGGAAAVELSPAKTTAIPALLELAGITSPPAAASLRRDGGAAGVKAALQQPPAAGAAAGDQDAAASLASAGDPAHVKAEPEQPPAAAAAVGGPPAAASLPSAGGLARVKAEPEEPTAAAAAGAAQHVQWPQAAPLPAVPKLQPAAGAAAGTAQPAAVQLSEAAPSAAPAVPKLRPSAASAVVAPQRAAAQLPKAAPQPPAAPLSEAASPPALPKLRPTAAPAVVAPQPAAAQVTEGAPLPAPPKGAAVPPLPTGSTGLPAATSGTAAVAGLAVAAGMPVATSGTASMTAPAATVAGLAAAAPAGPPPGAAGGAGRATGQPHRLLRLPAAAGVAVRGGLTAGQQKEAAVAKQQQQQFVGPAAAGSDSDLSAPPPSGPAKSNLSLSMQRVQQRGTGEQGSLPAHAGAAHRGQAPAPQEQPPQQPPSGSKPGAVAMAEMLQNRLKAATAVGLALAAAQQAAVPSSSSSRGLPQVGTSSPALAGWAGIVAGAGAADCAAQSAWEPPVQGGNLGWILSALDPAAADALRCVGAGPRQSALPPALAGEQGHGAAAAGPVLPASETAAGGIAAQWGRLGPLALAAQQGGGLPVTAPAQPAAGALAAPAPPDAGALAAEEMSSKLLLALRFAGLLPNAAKEAAFEECFVLDLRPGQQDGLYRNVVRAFGLHDTPLITRWVRHYMPALF